MKTRSILYYLLMLMPFVDMVTGYALNTNMTGVVTRLGQFYRIIMFIYLIHIITTHKFKKNVILLILLTLYTFTLVLINYLRFQGDVIENASTTLKLILPMYLVYGIYSISQHEHRFVETVFDAYAWIYPLSLVIPRVLGLGYYMGNYVFESGYKGFYYANNELNVILVVLFVFCCQKVYDDILGKERESRIVKINIYNIIKLQLIVVALILIGSKTSILVIVIVCLAYLFRSEEIKRKIKSVGIFLSIGVGSIFCITMMLNDQINNMALRIIYMYNRYAVSSGFATFLFSKRNLRIEPGVEYWYKNSSEGLWNFLFGIGKDTKCPNNSISTSPFSLIELDFFDCLFWFGIFAACIVLLFYLSFYFSSLRERGLFMEKLMFILVFLFSMTAGHVLTAANSGVVFAIVTAELFVKTQRIRSSSRKNRVKIPMR